MARPTLKEHWKFKRLVRILGIPTPHAVGYLECLWHVGYTSGDPYVGDSIAVEAAAEWVGEPNKLTLALADCGFIDRLDDEKFQIHDLHDHAPDYVQKRFKREQERKNKDLRQETADNGGQCPPNGGQRRTMAENVRPPAPAPAPAPIKDNLPSEDLSPGGDTIGDVGGDVKEVVDAWNEVAKAEGFRTVRVITPKRRNLIRKQLRNKFWRENWREAMQRIRGSPWLHGENDRGWVGTLAFFLKSDTVAEVMEGQWDARKPVDSGMPF